MRPHADDIIDCNAIHDQEAAIVTAQHESTGLALHLATIAEYPEPGYHIDGLQLNLGIALLMAALSGTLARNPEWLN
jgi:hypothetical protein